MKQEFFVQVSQAGIRAVRIRKKLDPEPDSRRALGATRFARRWEDSARAELKAYLAGRLRSFRVPCDLSGLPAFTRAVLRLTARIPYGRVRSYRWIAGRLGKPGASRAVGNALARNPIPIIIPCHRVVRSDGQLGGFALGLSWKRRLLKLEARCGGPRAPRRKRQGEWRSAERQGSVWR